MTPEAELLLFAASRAQLAREIIQPALAAGQIVISDRFLDPRPSTRECPPHSRDSVDLINQFAAGSRLPDVTFLLDMDPVAAMERARRRAKPPTALSRSRSISFTLYATVISPWPNAIPIASA